MNKKLILISLLIAALILSGCVSETEEQTETAPENGGNSAGEGEAPGETGAFQEDGCGEGTMLDAKNSLCWQKDGSAFKETFGENVRRRDAEEYCANLAIGEKNWRLPTTTELSRLIKENGDADYLNENTGFTGLEQQYYWADDLEEEHDLAYVYLHRSGIIGELVIAADMINVVCASEQ
jgi:hypothetical protein